MKLGTSTAFHQVTQREVANDDEALIVAEFGLNHNGSRDLALAMVRAAADAGCHAIKVQAYTAEEFCGPDETYSYRQWATGENVTVTERQVDLFRRCQLSFEDFQAIRDEVRRLGLYWIATATDLEWGRKMVTLGVDALKVGSDDLTHVPLLRALDGLGVPVILSTGMATWDEVRTGVEESHAQAVLHCVSLYPTPTTRANIGRMLALREKLGPTMAVGFSDHTEGTDAACLAMCRGAALIEKHFTLDRKLPGPDHLFSATASELRFLAHTSRNLARQTSRASLEPDIEEARMARLARRSIVAARDLPAYHIITPDDLAYRRPGTGMSPADADRVVGQVTSVAITAGAQVTVSALIRSFGDGLAN